MPIQAAQHSTPCLLLPFLDLGGMLRGGPGLLLVCPKRASPLSRCLKRGNSTTVAKHREQVCLAVQESTLSSDPTYTAFPDRRDDVMSVRVWGLPPNDRISPMTPTQRSWQPDEHGDSDGRKTATTHGVVGQRRHRKASAKTSTGQWTGWDSWLHPEKP
jgi:hypothetical protein